MCRSMGDINAELRETQYRMEKVSDDIAFMLMRGRLHDGETVSATPPPVTWNRVCEWLMSVFDAPEVWLTSQELPLFEVK